MDFKNKNELSNLSGIYAILNNKNKSVYIGQTKMRFIKRYWHHVWKLKHNEHDNIHLQSDWNKYEPSDFIFKAIKIIDISEPQSVFDEEETKYIKLAKEKYNCYNILIDANRRTGIEMSESAKK